MKHINLAQIPTILSQIIGLMNDIIEHSELRRREKFYVFAGHLLESIQDVSALIIRAAAGDIDVTDRNARIFSLYHSRRVISKRWFNRFWCWVPVSVITRLIMKRGGLRNLRQRVSKIVFTSQLSLTRSAMVTLIVFVYPRNRRYRGARHSWPLIISIKK